MMHGSTVTYRVAFASTLLSPPFASTILSGAQRALRAGTWPTPFATTAELTAAGRRNIGSIRLLSILQCCYFIDGKVV